MPRPMFPVSFSSRRGGAIWPEMPPNKTAPHVPSADVSEPAEYGRASPLKTYSYFSSTLNARVSYTLIIY